MRARTRASRNVALFLPALLNLGLCSYQLSLPHILLGTNGYDGGVYLGASIRLLQGFLPYRDFTIVYPPGSVLLLTPIAAVGRVLGTRDAMAIARCFCVIVASLNVLLVSLLARPLGRLAVFAAGLALACWPFAVSAEQMELEPFVVCFCLLGALAAFDHDAPANPRRLFVAGLAFGFAGTIREWAIVPVIAVLACLVWQRKDGIGRFVAGTVIGFCIPILPFFVLAPHAFIHDVFVTPVSEVPFAGHGAASIVMRLGTITGVASVPGLSSASGVGIGVAVGAGAILLALFFSRRHKASPLEWFVLIAAVLSVAMILFPRKFWNYFAYFPVTFLALLLGVAVSRILGTADGVAQRHHRTISLAQYARALVAIAVLVFASTFTYKSASYAAANLRPFLDPGGQIAAAIPAGKCVLFDEAVFAIAANRFADDGPRCPAVVDPVGFWWTEDPSHPPPYAGPSFPAHLVDVWRVWLGQSDYFVEAFPPSGFIPWTKSLRAWFKVNYRIVSRDRGAVVYRRITHVETTRHHPPG